MRFAMAPHHSCAKIVALWAVLSALVAPAHPLLVADTTAAESYDRRTFYSQPMGYSVWKPLPRSVDDFVALVEQDRLNATADQYARALYEAGWIPRADKEGAISFLRGLKEGVVPETKTHRIGRILRSYRTGEGKLDSNFYQVIKAGEGGYFDSEARLVVRKLCLNVLYPDRRVAVLPAHEERPVAVPELPAVALPHPGAEPPEPPTDFAFDPPPQFEPPAREAREPVSPSAP